jgi:ABC-type transport system substrate-binding protein
MLDDGKSYLVALGPAFSVVPATSAFVSVVPSGISGPLVVEGIGLPPSTVVEVVLIYGQPYANGLSVVESTEVVVGNNGQISAVIMAEDLPVGTHLVYIVADHDRILASAEVGTQIKVVFGGHPVDDPRVQEAILYAVFWKELTEQIFLELDVPVAIEQWEVGPVLTDAREVPFDPEQARQMLTQAGFADGFRLLLYFSPENEHLTTMAERIAEMLNELGIVPELLPVPRSNAQAEVAAMIAVGEPILWLR